MAVRIVLGFILTVALLGISRRLSTRRPRDLAVDGDGFRLEHRTVTEQVGPGRPDLALSVEGEQAHEPVVRYWVGNEEDPSPLR